MKKIIENFWDKVSRKKLHPADLAMAYRRVFDTEDGGVILYHLLDKLGYWRNPYDVDPCKMAFLAGQRNAAFMILSYLDIDVNKLLQERKRLTPIIDKGEWNDTSATIS